MSWFNKTRFLVVFFLFVSMCAQAQSYKRITGRVIDSKTKEPLAFVNLKIVGKNIGTITDYSGYYKIETQWASDSIEASFVGYSKSVKPLSSNSRQTVDFQLNPSNYQLSEVTVAAKKVKYRNKGNPAVELIEKVIKNKEQNRPEMFDYYEYKKYEKLEFDLNNITEEYKKKKVFKKFQFIFAMVDTSTVNNKPYLPVFLQENASDVYYRKESNDKKELITGSQMIQFHDFIDNNGVAQLTGNMYQKVDIYDNHIMLLTNQFVSPISPIAPMVYQFFIKDTIEFNGVKCINLVFQPRNKSDFAFMGDLLVTNDDRNAVVKCTMRVPSQINLNFVNDLEIIQEFQQIDNKIWLLTHDQIIIDFNIGKKGVGMFGKKNEYYSDFKFNQPRPDEDYSGIENSKKAPDYNKRDTAYWNQVRGDNFSSKEKRIYVLVDSMQHTTAFKNTMDIVMLFVSGYWNFNKIDVGAVNTFYSFNDVEGFRLRLGGRTSKKFSKTIRLDGNVLYGFKDEQFKYAGRLTWSLNHRPIDEFPQHKLRLIYQYETNFPGMEMQMVNEDNFLLSFKRGVADKIMYYRKAEIEHSIDLGNGFSHMLSLRNVIQNPGGNWNFSYSDGTKINDLTISEVVGQLRFAPNEKYYQGLDYKTPVFTKNPVFQLNYTFGFKDVLNSDYEYQKVSLQIFKRFYLSVLGYSDVEIRGEKVFGKGLPFPLLAMHRANQTYSYQLYSYNLMNFLEFVSDQYVSLSIDHNFNGFFFNKIPLLKHLKLRDVMSFKALYGNVTNANNPLYSTGLMQFPTNEKGELSTYTLDQKPYMEMSVGVSNIFKLFRVDLVRRLTYLDHPNVSEYGIRVRFKFDF